MGVLSKGQILTHLNQAITNDACLVISPLLQAKAAFDTESIDLRLGTHFLLPQLPPQPFFYPGSQSSRLGYQRVHIPLGAYLVVPAHQTVLGVTLEFIKLPYNISGQILTKSSVARTFVIIETAPWIHPEYRGCLTLEIANVSNTPLLLYPGRLVAQLILFDVPDAKPSPQYAGTYLGPVYPEPPMFRDPASDLAIIGVDREKMRTPAVETQQLDRCPECQHKVVAGATKCTFCQIKLPI
jgi:dCTP deaminase